MRVKTLMSPCYSRVLFALILGCASAITCFANPHPRIVNGSESAENAWPFSSALMYKSLGVSTNSETFDAFFMAGASISLFESVLIDCGKAFTPCDGAQGKICLIERGETFFSEKVKNCETSGGVGAIIFNNESGIFFGTLGDVTSHIPAVSVTQATGLELLNNVDKNVVLRFIDEKNPKHSFCGASYIGGKWLLTAAHCVFEVYPNALAVNVGGHDLEVNLENVLNVSRIVIHENYDHETNYHDIALVELVEEPQGISPVLLADESMTVSALANADTVVELGRGQQEAVPPGADAPIAPTPSKLFEFKTQLASNETCNTAFDNYFATQKIEAQQLVKPNMICAGSPEKSGGVCFGDSGGPLIVQKEGVDYLLGATSWGLGCAEPGLYDVFTRVSFYKDAIDNVTTGKSGKLEFNSNSDDDEGFFGASGLEFLLLGGIIAMLRWRRPNGF